MAFVLDLGDGERYLICGALIRSEWPRERLPVAVAICSELVPCPKHPDPVTPPRLIPPDPPPDVRSAESRSFMERYDDPDLMDTEG